MPPIKQILTKVSSLNGAQRRLGHYLQNDSTALLYANVNELARAVGVSNATVVRFAKSLGYKGFPEFKRDIQREMRRKLRAADRMEETFAQLRGEENILAKLINRDIQLLQETVRAVSYPDFHKAVELILRARKVFLIGLNASMQFALDRHIFGSIDDVRRRVDEFIESGVQHFELKIIYPTMDSLHRQMELWAENILPRYN